MGFWDYPIGGIRTPSKEWMSGLLEAQKAGKEIDDPFRLRLNAGKITKQYPKNTFPGHAAWLDWPWKLHRIETKKGMKLELYNLIEDPEERKDLTALRKSVRGRLTAESQGQNSERVKSMKARLEEWQRSVVRSLNGEDYR
jgi:hypothetical protein